MLQFILFSFEWENVPGLSTVEPNSFDIRSRKIPTGFVANNFSRTKDYTKHPTLLIHCQHIPRADKFDSELACNNLETIIIQTSNAEITVFWLPSLSSLFPNFFYL